MRAEFDDDLAGPNGVNDPMRPVHHVFQRLVGWKTGEDQIRTFSDLGRGLGGNAADLFEIGERTAAIAEDAVPGLDEMFANRQADLTDADEPDRLHQRLPDAPLPSSVLLCDLDGT